MSDMDLKTKCDRLREMLRDRCFWTGGYGGKLTREGYSVLVDAETACRDIDYRNAPLWPTADEAIDAVLNDESYWRP